MKPTPKNLLLTRDDFREGVFARDRHQCVVCKEPSKDAHHILERRLWPDGGYYLANGVSVCEVHHIEAEQTVISCERLRELAGINTVLLPEHLSPDQPYDKWGNPVLPNGNRMRGELFYETPVQKILAPLAHLFTDRVKYPRTFHLPWSPGLSDDDKVLRDLSLFEGKRVVVTVKMDGGNMTLYKDGLHGRSLEYAPHESRTWMRGEHARIARDIPEGWRVCGEDVFAVHSIEYRSLPDWFLAFSVWNQNICLPWDETVEWVNLLGLKMVPVLYDGVWDEKILRGLASTAHAGEVMEGYVVRLADAFPYPSFRRSVAKFVRAGHVQTDEHWMHQKVRRNGRVGVV